MRVAVVHNRDQSGVINVFGPKNRERYNPRTVERVAKALEHGGHTVRVIDGNMHVIEQLRDFMPRVIAGDRPGMVFNMAYGIQGVSRYTHLPAMLEMLGVPYVGSNPQAHAMALDKVIAKIIFESSGLPTAKFWNFASANDRFDDLEFPAIVKPKMEAVSYGIEIVHDEAELRRAVEYLVGEFQQHVLVEQFIPGREFAIGLLGNDDPEVLPIVEIDLEGDPNAIQSAGDKLRAPREKICPADLPPETTAELQALAKRAFRSLGLTDFSRVDLRMDADGTPYILEINSMASLGLTGTYVHAAGVAGYSFDDLVNRILDVAAVRYFGLDYLGEPPAPAAGAAGGTTKKPPRLSARIRSYLRSQDVTIEDSLRKMIDIRTPARDAERVNGLGDWLSAQLRAMGFKETTFSGVGVGQVRYFQNHDGEENDALLLGHLDVAWKGDYSAYRTEGTRIYGTGAAESKGGLAAALAALRALRYTRELRKAKVGFLLTTDETLEGARGRPIVTEIASHSRHVLSLKPGDMDGGIVSARPGRASFQVEVAYRPTARPRPHADVVAYFFRRLTSLQGLARNGRTVAITRVELHSGVGEPPDVAEASLTVKFDDPAEIETIEREVRDAASHRPPTGVRMHVTGGVRRPPREATPNEAFASAAIEIAGKLNQKITAGPRWHSSDICFVPAEVPTLDGLGPLGEKERTGDEYILRHSLIDRAALIAHLIIFCASGRQP